MLSSENRHYNRRGGAEADFCPRDGRTFSALDPRSCHPFGPSEEAEIMQEAVQPSTVEQRSREKIVIKDSCDIKVKTTETQVALSLQAALQVAIALVVNLTIADSDEAEKVTQDLLQLSRIEQSNRQNIFIENSRGIEVTTTDTDVAVSIQLLLQLLLALLIQIDVF